MRLDTVAYWLLKPATFKFVFSEAGFSAFLQKIGGDEEFGRAKFRGWQLSWILPIITMTVSWDVNRSKREEKVEATFRLVELWTMCVLFYSIIGAVICSDSCTKLLDKALLMLGVGLWCLIVPWLNWQIFRIALHWYK